LINFEDSILNNKIFQKIIYFFHHQKKNLKTEKIEIFCNISTNNIISVKAAKVLWMPSAPTQALP
jgi:uncharacterized membrane protein YbaN (DUF454 family)